MDKAEAETKVAELQQYVGKLCRVYHEIFLEDPVDEYTFVITGFKVRSFGGRNELYAEGLINGHPDALFFNTGGWKLEVYGVGIIT